MSREKQIDIIRDLLVEFDEMGFAPTTLVPNPEAYAIDWRNKLTNALREYRKQSKNVIELPCRVDDTIFVIRNDIIEQETVRGIKIGNCGLLLQVSRGVDNFEYHYDIEIGNKLFFAKEEAEAKMKGENK